MAKDVGPPAVICQLRTGTLKRDSDLTLPNYLSVFRLCSVPVLLLLAWFNKERIFVVLLIFAFITDAIDGPIARGTEQESLLGSRLDSWADVSIYLTLPVCAWWLWPEIIMRELEYVLAVIASVAIPALAGIVKFRDTTSYHTWMVKVAAVCTTVSSLLMFLEVTSLPFQVSAVICVLAGVEEVLITLVLEKPQSNVRTLWHVVTGNGRD